MLTTAVLKVKVGRSTESITQAFKLSLIRNQVFLNNADTRHIRKIVMAANQATCRFLILMLQGIQMPVSRIAMVSKVNQATCPANFPSSSGLQAPLIESSSESKSMTPDSTNTAGSIETSSSREPLYAHLYTKKTLIGRNNQTSPVVVPLSLLTYHFQTSLEQCTRKAGS